VLAVEWEFGKIWLVGIWWGGRADAQGLRGDPMGDVEVNIGLLGPL